jgi:hypothetical protein
VPSPSVSSRPRRRSGALAAAAVTLIAAACSGGTAAASPPAATALVTTISSSLSAVKQFDAHLTLAGTISSSLDGAVASGAAASAAAPLKLDGTAMEIRSDTVAGTSDLSLTLPTALAGGGVSEVIVVGSDVYLKLGPIGTALGVADDGKFHHTTTSTLGALGGLPGASASASADPSQMAQALSAMTDFFDSLSQAPTVTGVTCGNTSCWDLHVVLTPADLAALAAKGASVLASAVPFAPLPTGGMAGLTDVTLDVIARQADGRPAEIKVAVDGGQAGTASADLTLTFDTPMTITAPPADQVVEGFPTFLNP